MLSLVELDEVQELVCYDCKDEGEDAIKEVYCSGCKKKKPLDTFLAVTRKWIHKKYNRCRSRDACALLRQVSVPALRRMRDLCARARAPATATTGLLLRSLHTCTQTQAMHCV